MQNLLKIQTTDTYKIITGLGQLTQDPESTRAKAAPLLQQVPEQKEVIKINADRVELSRQAKVAKNRAKEADRQGGIEGAKPELEQNATIINRHKNDYEGYNREYKDKTGAARLLNVDLSRLSVVVKEKHKQIKRDNPVFCHPGGSGLVDRGIEICGWIDETTGAYGETVPGTHAILEDADLDGVLVPEGFTVASLLALWMARGENEQITVEGETVADFRGSVVWNKSSGSWVKTTIETLGTVAGDLAGDYLDTDLTDEQRAEIADKQETERLEGLSPEDKNAEYLVKKSGLASQAQQKENELKFDGDPDFLSKAQAWYDSELVILKLKYGVE